MAECQTDGIKTDVHRLAHFETRKGLYIYNHDNQIYFLDGINKPHLVANGTDGVLFLDKARNQPFDYLEDTPPGCWSNQSVLTGTAVTWM